jgi:hypothetical protein
VLVAAALVVATILASTAYAISSWVGGGEVITSGVAEQEYLQAQHQLELPPGVTWPSLQFPPGLIGRGAGGGHAVLVAENAWECYWVKAIQRGDPTAQTEAQAELSSLLEHNVIEAPAGAPENWTPPDPLAVPFVVFAHDGGLAWVRRAWADAAAGHPRNLVDRCRANRPGRSDPRP